MIALQLARPQPSSTTLALKFTIKDKLALQQLRNMRDADIISTAALKRNRLFICCDGAGDPLEDRIVIVRLLRWIAEGKARLYYDGSEHKLFAFNDYAVGDNMLSSYDAVYLVGLHFDPCPVKCPMCYLSSTWSRPKQSSPRHDYEYYVKRTKPVVEHVVKLIESIYNKKVEQLKDRFSFEYVNIYLAFTSPDISYDPYYYYYFVSEFVRHQFFKRVNAEYENPGIISIYEDRGEKGKIYMNIYFVVSSTPWHEYNGLFDDVLKIHPPYTITLTHEPKQFKLDFVDYNTKLIDVITELKRRYRSEVVINDLLYRYRVKEHGEVKEYVSTRPFEEVYRLADYIQIVSYHPSKLGWLPPKVDDILDRITMILESRPVSALMLDASTTVRLFRQHPEAVAWVHRMEKERYYRCDQSSCRNGFICPRDSDRCLALET